MVIQQDTLCNGYRHWFPKLLRRQSTGGCRFNPNYRRVTIQEYLTLVPSYGYQNQNRQPRGFNKGRSSKFHVGSQVRQTPEEGRRTYWPKCCGNNNKDEDNSPKTLYDKNHQASSKKFRLQMLDKAVWISHSANTLGKDIHPTILLTFASK